MSWTIPIWVGVLGTVCTLIFQSLGPGFVDRLFEYNLQYNYEIVDSTLPDGQITPKQITLLCQVRNTGEDSLSEITILTRSYNPGVHDIRVVTNGVVEEPPTITSPAFVERIVRFKDKLLPGQSKFVEFMLIFREQQESSHLLSQPIQEAKDSVPKDLDVMFEVYSEETRGILNDKLGRYSKTNYRSTVTRSVKAIGYIFIQIVIWIIIPLITVLLVARYLLIGLALYLKKRK